MRLTLVFEVDPSEDPEGLFDPTHETGLTHEGFLRLSGAGEPLDVSALGSLQSVERSE